MSDEGWEQVEAGMALISWSRLAKWDPDKLVFTPEDEHVFEHLPNGHRAIHPTKGRLIAWLAFAIGGEYVAKGVCIINRRLDGQVKYVLRTPQPAEDVGRYVRSVNDYVEN
jgi:hypothetical protein